MKDNNSKEDIDTETLIAEVSKLKREIAKLERQTKRDYFYLEKEVSRQFYLFWGLWGFSILLSLFLAPSN